MNTSKKGATATVKGKKSRVNWRRLITVIVVAGLCIYAVWTLVSQEIEIQKTKKELTELNTKLEEQNALREDLEEQKETVNTPEYIEKAARDELGYAAPDEIIFKDASQE